MAISTISRVKNLSTARPCANLRFREETKGNLVDLASNHMLVSKTNSFSRGQICGFGARMAIFTNSRVKNLSTAGPWTNLTFREETKGNLVDPASSHMLVSKTNSISRGQISGFGARIAFFTISRVKNLSTAGPWTNLRLREETKGNLSLRQWPCISRIII